MAPSKQAEATVSILMANNGEYDLAFKQVYQYDAKEYRNNIMGGISWLSLIGILYVYSDM